MKMICSKQEETMDITIEDEGVRDGDFIFYANGTVTWSPIYVAKKSPAERMKSALNNKYVNKYERKQRHKANNFCYRPTLKPSKKYGQCIESGLSPLDTACIGVAIYYLGKWQKDWKLGFHPDVECAHIRFKSGYKKK